MVRRQHVVRYLESHQAQARLLHRDLVVKYGAGRAVPTCAIRAIFSVSWLGLALACAQTTGPNAGTASGRQDAGSDTAAPPQATWIDAHTPLGSTKEPYREPVDDDCHVVAVDVNAGNGCAVTAAGYVYCWGLDAMGALGSEGAPDVCLFGLPGEEREIPCSLEPVRITGIDRAIEVSYGGAPCALGDDGHVRCWGSNHGQVLGAYTAGECANPFATDPSHPMRVPCSADPVLVEDLGGALHLRAWGQTCALTESEGIKCWGYGARASTSVPGTEHAMGMAPSCSLLDDGAVRCWGSAESGRLGTSQEIGNCPGPWNQPCTLSAVPVELQIAAVDVSSGWHHACAVTIEHEVYCWGHNGYGQLGLARASEICPSGFPCERLPQQVPMLDDIRRVFAGIGSTCALTTDGRALCWGNLPIAGLTGTAPREREVPLPGRVVTMSAERSGLCFVLEDGTLYCSGLRYLRENGVGVLSSAWHLERIDVCGD